MNTYLWIIFYTFAIFSFIPVVKLEEVKSNKTYRKLWYLSISVFMWSLVIAFRFIATTPFFIYYFSLLTYPIVALITYFIYLTIKHYTNEKTSRYFHYAFISFIVINFIVSVTNPFHQLVLKLPLDSSITLASYQNSLYGFLFYIHAILCYITLLIGFIRLLKYVRKEGRKNLTSFPFQLILFSIIFGISINAIHLFIYNFVLDPTYIFTVLISYLLYTFVYKKDYNLNLFISSKAFILNNMREMYLILDSEEHIVEYSINLKERYHLDFKERQEFSIFLEKIKDKAIIFSDISKIKKDENARNKSYLHMTRKEFNVGAFKEKGHLILLYDETADVNLLHEIEYISKHDYLTNLYNRNYLEEIKKSYDQKYLKMAIIMIDMDGLKLYNDYLGHKAGDELLKRFSKLLMTVSNQYNESKVIRMGGDEFIIILPVANQKLCEEVIRSLEKETLKKKINETIGFSYGISLRRNEADNISLMMKRADKRMYENKSRKDDYKRKLEDYFINIESLKK